MTTNPFKTEGNRELFPEAEGVPQATVALAKQSQQDELERKQLEKLNAIADLDWKAIPPPVLAQLLVQMPFKGRTGEPDYFLKPWQAMVFAMRCFELGLSPFSNEVWFNTQNNKANVTFEGKLKLARKQGLNLGPPRFTEVKRVFPKGRVIAGFPEDIGYKCTMTTSKAGDMAEYTAWLSEWYVPTSPVWKSKPDHMLQLRAAEKCLSFASGIGSSELPDEQDIRGSADTGFVSAMENQPLTTGPESTEFTEVKP